MGVYLQFLFKSKQWPYEEVVMVLNVEIIYYIDHDVKLDITKLFTFFTKDGSRVFDY